MAVTTVEQTDTLDAGRVKINNNFAQTLNKTVSPTAGLYPTVSLHAIQPINSGTTDFEFLHYGKVTGQTDTDRLALPKGMVIINWSVNLVNNWVWDEAQQRAEPADVAFPMVALELGGEGVLCHYTAPGEASPATAFHEINRFGGSVDGLSGVSPYTVHVPFNQFKACIYACYSSTTTPDAGTELPWWGGTNNTLGGILNPLLWLRSEETKGTDFEFAAFEQNSSNASPSALYFKKSRGTNETKTAISSGDVVGRIGWKAYDGDEYHITAFMDAVAPGNASNNSAPLDIRFYTAPTSAASAVERLRLTGSGIVKHYIPVRQEISTVTGIPDYSGVGAFSPVITGSIVSHLGVASTASGGINIVGFTNVTAGGLPFVMRGTHGHTSPTAPAMLFVGSKHNGTTAFADLAAAEIVFQLRNNTATIMEVLGSGCAGFGATTPTAFVHCGASTTTRAGLRVVPGAAPSSPNNGDIWIDSTAHTMHVRINGVTKSINLT